MFQQYRGAPLLKLKRAPTVVSAPKNANPDCRLTKLNKKGISHHNHLVELAFFPNSKNDYDEKRYSYPIEKNTINLII